jgi:hypothetical protein
LNRELVMRHTASFAVVHCARGATVLLSRRQLSAMLLLDRWCCQGGLEVHQIDGTWYRTIGYRPGLAWYYEDEGVNDGTTQPVRRHKIAHPNKSQQTGTRVDIFAARPNFAIRPEYDRLLTPIAIRRTLGLRSWVNEGNRTVVASCKSRKRCELAINVWVARPLMYCSSRDVWCLNCHR